MQNSSNNGSKNGALLLFSVVQIMAPLFANNGMSARPCSGGGGGHGGDGGQRNAGAGVVHEERRGGETGRAREGVEGRGGSPPTVTETSYRM